MVRFSEVLEGYYNPKRAYRPSKYADPRYDFKPQPRKIKNITANMAPAHSAETLPQHRQHSTEGPAVEWDNGIKEYYLNGYQVSPEVFEKAIATYKGEWRNFSPSMVK